MIAREQYWGTVESGKWRRQDSCSGRATLRLSASADDDLLRRLRACLLKPSSRLARAMDVPDSPSAPVKRAVSRTYGRAFRQRTSFGGAGTGGGSSGASTPSAAGAPSRRKVADLSSSDDEAGSPLPQIKKPRQSLPTAGASTVRLRAGTKRKAATVVEAPTRASPRQASSLKASSLTEGTSADTGASEALPLSGPA